MLWQLFYEFAKIGSFTIGGGYAMLPLMERAVVDKRGWMDKESFLDLVAVAQSAPGVLAVNMAIFTGYKLKGFIGSLIAVLGTILAPFFTILLLALFFRAFKDNPVVLRIFMGIRPVVVALIAVPVITTARTVGFTLPTALMAVTATLLIWIFGVSPVWIVLGAALIGYVAYRWDKRKGRANP